MSSDADETLPATPRALHEVRQDEHSDARTSLGDVRFVSRRELEGLQRRIDAGFLDAREHANRMRIDLQQQISDYAGKVDSVLADNADRRTRQRQKMRSYARTALILLGVIAGFTGASTLIYVWRVLGRG